jgi:hypothetical protein
MDQQYTHKLTRSIPDRDAAQMLQTPRHQSQDQPGL